jgi:hypothetical protein
MGQAIALISLLFSFGTAPEPQPGAAVADIEVEWHGSWYPAQVLDQRGDQRLIRYVGYDARWDEWVGPTRRRSLGAGNPVVIAAGQWRVGDPIEVEWGSTWWPATVLEINAASTKIRYDGYDASWDEWVEPGRIR